MGTQNATRVNAQRNLPRGSWEGNAPAAKQSTPQVNNAVGQLGAGIQNLQGANLQGVQSAANAAQNVNVAPMQQVAGQLQGFNPIQGAAAGTLQNIIATGNPVNVDPITQAAQQQAQLTFGNLMPQVNEQFGALGLGSSSAREAEALRQAGQISTGVGIEGLRAGVGAQENAAQRQLQGFNPLLQGTGQQLAGMQSAGQLQGQASGLQLQGAGTAGQLRLGAAGEENQFNLGKVNAGQNFVNPLLQQQGQQMNMPPATGGTSVLPTGGMMTKGRVTGYAQGGRVDYGDYLSDMLFGQQFTRRGPTQDMQRPMRQLAPQNPVEGLQKQMLREQLKRMQAPRDHVGRAQENTAGLVRYLNQGGSGMVPIGMQDPGALSDWLKWMGPQRVHEGLMQSGRLLASSSGLRGMDPGGEKAKAGARFGNQLEQERAQGFVNMGINPLTGQRFRAGGEVDGPSVPPDVVPIMAQGGELVVPIPLRHKIEMSDSTDPIVQELKGLIDKPVDPHGMAGGGLIHGLVDSTYGVDELARAGAENYPSLPQGSRHHAEGTRRLAEKIGFIPTQLAGLGVEGAERMLAGHWGDVGNDLVANAIGGAEGAINRMVPFVDAGTILRQIIQGKQHGGPVLDPRYQNLAPSRPQPSIGSIAPPRGANNIPDDIAPSFTNADLAGSQTQVNPLQDLAARLQHANTRVSLMSSLIGRSPTGARAKLQGLLANAVAERDAVASEKAQAQEQMQALLGVQQAAMLQRAKDQAAMERVKATQSGMTERAREQETLRTERESQAARARQEADVFGAALKASPTTGSIDPAGAAEALQVFRQSQGAQSTMGPPAPVQPQQPSFSEEDMSAANELETYVQSGAELPEDMYVEVIPQLRMLREYMGEAEFVKQFPALAQLVE